jgi:hypothetical protein
MPDPLIVPHPKAVQLYRTSDDKEFRSVEEARLHEVFLAVRPYLPAKHAGSADHVTAADYRSATSVAVYEAVKALASRFDFVQRY